MRTFLSLALLALALPAAAQPSFGIKVGVNAASISDIDEDFGDDDDGFVETQSRLGLTIGVTADIPFTPSLSFRPELLYVQKGFTTDFDIPAGVFDPDEGLDGSVTSEVDYLEVPLLLAYTFPTSSPLEIAIEAGPTLAYKLRTGVGCSGDFDEECEEDDEFDDEDGHPRLRPGRRHRCDGRVGSVRRRRALHEQPHLDRRGRRVRPGRLQPAQPGADGVADVTASAASPPTAADARPLALAGGRASRSGPPPGTITSRTVSNMGGASQVGREDAGSSVGPGGHHAWCPYERLPV